MKGTVQISIQVGDEQLKEQLIAQLSTRGFDAFEEMDNELLAFIEEEKFDSSLLNEVVGIDKLPVTKTIVEAQNWNALWESNFQPVVVENFCAIRADFHLPFTDKAHEIIITPKMSFGTGHHATTYMMISEMSNLDFSNKRVADFGTGTGVLAILAEKMGSKEVLAIDYDNWSIENARENVEKNNCNHIIIEKADRFIADDSYDIVLANINKNVILSNVDALCAGARDNRLVLLSGLLKEDENDVVMAFEGKGFKHQSTVEKNNWVCLLLKYD